MLYSALIGHPVDHSISPVLFNYLAQQVGLEYGHLKIDVPSASKLANCLAALKNLGFCGANITLPYKLAVDSHLDRISPEARKIGAVNTVVFKGDRAIGYNTDADGALAAIETKLKPVKGSDQVLILGAGGAARAIVYPLYKKTKNIIILNRDQKEAAALVRDLSGGRIKQARLTDDNIRQHLAPSNIIVNATPVGMFPKDRERIIKERIFSTVAVRGKYFFDAIFNPYRTSFLEDARRHGARTCSGTYMMIYQAIRAFALWTGRDVTNIDVEAANSIMRRALKE